MTGVVFLELELPNWWPQLWHWGSYHCITTNDVLRLRSR